MRTKFPLLTWLISCLLLTSVGATIAAPPASVAPQTASAARDLADQIIAAYGGLEKLKEMKASASRSKGRFSVISTISGAANTFSCDMLSKGDKLRIETTVLGQTMILGYDGKNSWTQFGDWISPSTETTAKRIAEELQHGLNLLIQAGSPDAKLEILGRKRLNDKTYAVLKVIAEDGKPTTFYADEKTRLIAKSEYVGTDREQGVPAVLSVEYFDYRPVAGCLTAYKTIEYSGSKKTAETVFEKMEVDPSIADSVFIMPPETEIARVKDSPVTIPFEFKSNEIVIKVRINGKGDYKFIVDTGASQCVVDKSTASSIGAYSVSNFSITSGSKAMPLSYMTLNSVSMGDLTVDNIPALVTDLSAFAQALGERPAGLIGANLLRRFLVTIDFRDKKLVLANPRNVQVPSNAAVITTSPIFGATALVVAGKLDNKVPLNFLVDTGAAFNNLPQSAVKKLAGGSVLPVGQVFGIDGQKVDIGSIRLNSLHLGPLVIARPVFGTAPSAQAVPAQGLFSAGSMGILGNPVWSQYRMTIDYRNERLILEPLADKIALESIVGDLHRVYSQLLTNNNLDQAITAYQKIAISAQQRSSKAGEALAVACLAQTYGEKFARSGDGRWSTLAGQSFGRAVELGRQSRDDAVQGKVLAQWASFQLKNARTPNDLIGAQALLVKAIQMAPTEPATYACLGLTSLKIGKIPIATKLLDQAIMLDPANWPALWGKYRIFQSQGKTSEQKLVLAQLKRYYPEAAELKALLQSRSPARKTVTRKAAPGKGR